MDILFGDSKLEKTCNSDTKLQRKYGQEGFRKIAQRLAQLRSCESLDDMKRYSPAKLHPLQERNKDGRKGHFAVSLHGGWRLIFKASKRCSTADSWQEITEIIITEIEDYH